MAWLSRLPLYHTRRGLMQAHNQLSCLQCATLTMSTKPHRANDDKGSTTTTTTTMTEEQQAAQNITEKDGQSNGDEGPKEYGGPSGPEPTRYNDWERNGRVSDF
eukprot:m.41951 g.41951  ORF g.41951 m.41951 type:complete len:104 (+) comp10630_c0_seq1:130-441(+)